MAKSKSFYGLRSGSTKSHTYQVLRGEQITKDRVSEVSNPQTNNQMNQRLLLPLVAAAASQLEGLVNHSFEGVDYGYRSVSKFRSLNLTKGNLKVSSYVPKGAMDCGEAEFIVSRGSLPSFSYTMTDQDDKEYQVDNFSESKLPIAEVTGSSTKAGFVKAIKQGYGLSDGDQISFLSQHGVGTYPYIVNDVQKTGTRHGFVLSRLILDADDNAEWTVTASDSDDNANIIATDGYTVLTLEGKADADGNNITFTNLSVSIKGTNIPATQQEICGAAVILSRKVNNSWKRSSQNISIMANLHEIPYDDAVNGYLKSSAASAKYLNTGNDPTGIAGDSMTK